MAGKNDSSTPICRCRVLYLGSAVPHITKDGLQGIQEPLKELYPAEGAMGAKGIDSWLSVWSNGLLLENVDENHKKVTRFFPIETLHYCAAVRYVLVPGNTAKFLPLDSPFARNPNINHPPLFACILRRTSGIKVLECHSFICKREAPANALVRCCFHAYADSTYAKQLDSSIYGTIYGTVPSNPKNGESSVPVDSIEKVEEWHLDDDDDEEEGAFKKVGRISNGSSPLHENGLSNGVENPDEISVYNGDENHKVWAGAAPTERETIYNDYGSTAQSLSSIYGSRLNRPRQMMSSVAPPPPPEVEKKKKDKKKKKEKDHEPITNGYPPPNRQTNNVPHQRYANGFVGSNKQANGAAGRPVNGVIYQRPVSAMKQRPASVNGSLLRPPHQRRASSQMNGHSPLAMRTLPPRPTRRPGPPPGPIPNGKIKPGKPLPPPLIMPPPHMLHTHYQGARLMLPPMMGPPVGLRRPHSGTLEEPIYMPSTRPMSPTASYQPGHFPHEAYLFQHYATTDRRRYKKKKPKHEEDPESPYNTGIYKKKGHLNERAFSYSIRQEHRSRSYGSLANLKFGNGDIPMSKEESKKERELRQLVHDLDLSGDELERQEVRPGMYRGPDTVSQTSRNSGRLALRR